jgi:hypothetical protein
MAFVPGYKHDVFVSYAHGDNREWISRFVGRLESALKNKLGDSADVWLDDSDLRATRNFRREIPDSVTGTAVFLLLPSPAYIRSQYCVEIECRAFEETLPSKKSRFTGQAFANEEYAIRCPIEEVDNNEHWQLFPGLTDIPFFDASGTYAVGKPKFEKSFSELTQTLLPLLKRMRNGCTPVFVYPPNPEEDELKKARESLVNELGDLSYRVLPDRYVNLADQLREASLAVFLQGETYDSTVKELAEVARQQGRPWVVWCSSTGEDTKVPEQMAQLEFLEQMDAPKKTYLNAGKSTDKLKEEVRSLLNPDPRAIAGAGGKRRVYLIYKSGDRAERMNAGRIATSFDNEFRFDHPDDPAQHTALLTGSDGVLLLWGNAEEDWCAHEFEAVARSARAKGLCVFDPKGTKDVALQQIREKARDVYIAEQFGNFERWRLEQFFNLIRRPA